MNAERRPTVPQVYALAGALCARADERFPETRAEASALASGCAGSSGIPRPLSETRRPEREGGRKGA